MGLYLGSSGKLKVVLNNIPYCLKIFSETPITNGSLLLSSDGYILTDANEIYIVANGGE